MVMQEVSSEDKSDISSVQMHQAVLQAFEKQKQRGQKRLNGKLNEEEIETYCTMSPEAGNVIENAVGKFGLSHRSIASLKKISRTIADLSLHEKIEKSDILEALSYRRRK